MGGSTEREGDETAKKRGTGEEEDMTESDDLSLQL